MKTMLLLADDPAVVRAVRLALRSAGAFRVVATLDGRAPAREALRRHAPDVVLVDEMCQRTNAEARLNEAAEAAPGATIVLLTTGFAARDERFEAGAHAVVSRRLHPSTLGTLLREIANGSVVHAPPRPGRGHLRALADQDARTSA